MIISMKLLKQIKSLFISIKIHLVSFLENVLNMNNTNIISIKTWKESQTKECQDSPAKIQEQPINTEINTSNLYLYTVYLRKIQMCMLLNNEVNLVTFFLSFMVGHLQQSNIGMAGWLAGWLHWKASKSKPCKHTKLF